MNFSTLRLSSLSLPFCLILIFQSSLQTNAGVCNSPDAMIDKICKEIGNDQCTHILKADPKISSVKNYLEFSKAILELSIEKGTEGQKFLKELAEAKKDSPAIVTCANFCYSRAIASFKSAMEELTIDPTMASYDAGAAGDDPRKCAKLLAEEHIVNPKISALNNQTMLFSAIASSAIYELVEDPGKV